MRLSTIVLLIALATLLPPAIVTAAPEPLAGTEVTIADPGGRQVILLIHAFEDEQQLLVTGAEAKKIAKASKSTVQQADGTGDGIKDLIITAPMEDMGALAQQYQASGDMAAMMELASRMSLVIPGTEDLDSDKLPEYVLKSGADAASLCRMFVFEGDETHSAALAGLLTGLQQGSIKPSVDETAAASTTESIQGLDVLVRTVPGGSLYRAHLVPGADGETAVVWSAAE